ncbi:MAG: FG-GAP repeat domain-containing protein [Rubripirellula sp.]
MKIALNGLLLCWIATASIGAEPPTIWTRHTIDDSSRGADGTRVADVNGDGLMDIATGWEQGNVTRVYLNPGPAQSKKTWPSVTVGKTPAVEDAVFVDLNRDGATDVVTCGEGKSPGLRVHWAPDQKRYLKSKEWQTRLIPGSDQMFRWMFATSMDVDRDGQVDIVAGGKSPKSLLGWWKVPSAAQDTDHWRWNPLRPMGWLMALEATDMDGDGDDDLLFTDRKEKRSGCFWLRNPGSVESEWQEVAVGAVGKEPMFLHRVDLDRDGLRDIVVAVRPMTIVLCRSLSSDGTKWQETEIKIPETFGGSKGLKVADINGDGKLQIVFSTERAEQGKFGIGVCSARGEVFSSDWSIETISGSDGIKHDLIELLDLDQDGDLDVLTCEERKNLGVIWYENPRF